MNVERGYRLERGTRPARFKRSRTHIIALFGEIVVKSAREVVDYTISVLHHGSCHLHRAGPEQNKFKRVPPRFYTTHSAYVHSGKFFVIRKLRNDEVKPSLEIPAPEDKNKLGTDLCGIPLENPFLLSSSVVASTYDSVKELVGLAAETVSDSTNVLERDTVLFPKFDRKKCIGCGRCAVSCSDGGHSAIKQSEDGKPRLDGSKCVGCHLCLIVCPEGAIGTAKKRIDRRK